MAFGLGKLAQAIEKTGANAPQWIVETLKRADQENVLKRLTGDAVAGIWLKIDVPVIRVRIGKLTLFTVGPFSIQITGLDPGEYQGKE